MDESNCLFLFKTKTKCDFYFSCLRGEKLNSNKMKQTAGQLEMEIENLLTKRKL